MTKDCSFVHQIAASSGEDPAVVNRVIEEFCLALRRGLDEYKSINGDCIEVDLFLLPKVTVGKLALA